MVEHLYPALFALFVWWFSTGVIIFLDGLPERTFKWSMIGASVVLGVSLFGLAQTATDISLTGAYLAFTFGLLAWGWLEISFLMGYVTGPRKEACPEDCQGIRHFWHGVEVVLWHELAIVATFCAILALTWASPNQVGLWTFVVLWLMRQSAKLNVFLGVRNLSEEFLPEKLAYLKRYLNKRPMNLLFPVSVTLSTVICVMLFDRAFAADASAFEATAFTFTAVMLALAILEHWFLVLPLPAARLWHWGLKSRKARTGFDPVSTKTAGHGLAGGEPAAPAPTAFRTKLPATCEAMPLRALLEAIATGAYGHIDRVKGIARSGDGWIKFDVSGGRPSIAAFAAADDEEPRVVAIGNDIDADRLELAFGACQREAA